jgi:dihydrofolate synthase / folylpolyglutamate synthase
LRRPFFLIDKMSKALSDWLQHCEGLHVLGALGIDLSLDRVRVVVERLGLSFEQQVVITVAGTNGKGSTCAMLESILLQAGYHVAVYSSPHLIRFEERLRLDGAEVAGDTLPEHFAAVEAARQGIALTYFEFTTLALLRRIKACPAMDVVILEVGLGGRLDAVNVINPDCAVITCIDLDHMDFLGPDRESIGREKAGIMRAGRPVIVSDPAPPASVADEARRVGADLWQNGLDFGITGDRQQWSFSGRGRRWNALAYPALRGANQLLNAAGVLAVLAALRERLPVPVQAIRNGLALVELPGRFQVLPGQPAVVLDVGHNPHAAAVLANNLDQMGFFPRNFAILGAMADKDLDGLLTPLLALVDEWHCCDLPTPRAASASGLAEQIGRLRPEAVIHTHASPAEALAAVKDRADPADRIVVFGSFYTVGGVLQQGTARRI